MKRSGVDVKDLDAIAFTRGPGLMGSLLVGVSYAKGLAIALDKPLIEVNHMEAHVLSHFIDEPHPMFPFLCLTVSGGHTQLIVVHDYLSMKVIGETQDDAAGEAFDKAAKIIGFPYPGGPLIDKLAAEGNPAKYKFPQTSMPGLDFSFSGTKTAFLYFIRDEKTLNPLFVEQNKADICASLQHHLVTMLTDRLEQASLQTGINEIAISGGVAANSGLRKRLAEIAKRKGWRVFIPKPEYCTDNAAMIAMAAHYKFLAAMFADLRVIPLARMPIAT